MSDSLISPQARARFVVTLPPEPNLLAPELAYAAGASFTTLTDTRDAFLHLARKAQERLVIMTPFIDAAGARWATDLFEATNARDKILVLRDADRLRAIGAAGAALLAITSRVFQYELNHSEGGQTYSETFHAKIVLADGVAAYVGSANFLRRSREANLECGFLLEGDAVNPIVVLINAVLAVCAA